MANHSSMATHSRVLAWRIPGTVEPGGLPSMGSPSRTRLKQLSSSSSSQYSCLEHPMDRGMVLLLLSRFSCVRLCVIPRTAAIRLPRPWDSPGKNTGVGCHFLLQCMKVKSEREVAQSCPTLSDPMDCSPPGSSIHGIFQAKY